MRGGAGESEDDEGDIPMHTIGSNGHVANGTATSAKIQSQPWHVNVVHNITHIPPSFLQSIAFFAFGLLNNALYVVILTAALELIPTGTPTGVVAFANIAPALVAKAVWPYVLKGEVRYARRIWSCVAMNLTGILVSI